MERLYSTLELAKFDDTARAPECDYDATAFELDAGALAPEAVPDGSPQVLYNSSLPEAQSNEDYTENGTPSLRIPKRAPKWSWLVMALLIIAIIAVGVAFGIWRRHEHSSHESSAVISPPAPQNHSNTPIAQLILDDTSLAAVSDFNGNRYLFFQDPTGLIRGALRTDNQWSTRFNLGIDAKAKNYTPLAVTTPSSDELWIRLYYVSKLDFLSSSYYAGGLWTPDTGGSATSLGNYSTAVNTRSLSVSNGNLNTTFPVNPSLLYYENSAGNVSALFQSVVDSNDIEGNSNTWTDVTSQESKLLPDEFRNTIASTAEGYSKTLYESLVANIVTFSAPFACGANWTQDSAIGAIFYSPNASISDFNFLFNSYTTGPSSAGNFSQMNPIIADEPTALQDYSSIHQSDIALVGSQYAIWINHTQPAVITMNDGEITPPNNAFPFTRLASMTLADNSYTYLYHQINGTTFAEEQWDNAAGAWTATEYITISY